MDEEARRNAVEEERRFLKSPSRHKQFLVEGQLVTVSDRENGPAAAEPPEKQDGSAQRFLSPPEILTIEEVARRPIDGIDTNAILNHMANIGSEARFFIHRRDGKIVRSEVFEDPRICPDINRGAVVENLREKPKDVSGWRTHEFFIDTKGCLGDECGRCAIMCPENAIHLMGKGKGSFHEIDPLACKGCFICWVECYRTAADCILVDGKTFDPGMRAKHFGE
jgi:Pyruvate/2-oxoacid:ferredoxin oxidoreductase delta subunit